jgi:hypothetical protein
VLLAGHIKVFRGPHVAYGPDVARAWSKKCFLYLYKLNTVVFFSVKKTTNVNPPFSDVRKKPNVMQREDYRINTHSLVEEICL